MKTTLQKWGNSQGVRIPKSIIDTLGIDVGCEVKLELSGDQSKITISPTVDARPVRGRHRIENLLESSPTDAFKGEVDWGKPEGQEAW
ncbi:MAG: AbrB/MazE/SpoVT family DNA-binding domain-containing protein [Verrucomicrobia bacterium]|nr:AbrB/MazE/SpoVT family DNA-binding domain-containing protein [Verrucomicrobiota bacterium]